MTIEGHSYIEMSDIVAVRFTCMRCGTSTTYPLKNQQVVPFACDNCTEGKWFTDDRERAGKLKDLLDQLSRFPETYRSANLQLQFELKDDPAKH